VLDSSEMSIDEVLNSGLEIVEKIGIQPRQ